ncbi:MAG: hypothetical protein AAFZ92_01890 [Pseudomonadota bacterium]
MPAKIPCFFFTYGVSSSTLHRFGLGLSPHMALTRLRVKKVATVAHSALARGVSRRGRFAGAMFSLR